MRLALFQPDIPQNTGTLIRLGACLGVPIDIIEPCGFILDDRRLRRSAMDYAAQAELVRHVNWAAFQASRHGRTVLVETDQGAPYTDFVFRPGDTLLLGRETAGTPPEVAAACTDRVFIPMRSGVRSLNLAVAASMVLGEALRQTSGFPEPDPAHRDPDRSALPRIDG
ncbi:tRNA (cytidine(34)-2'-O)-methyltransferase [Oleisolibacter albus]|uniref:tRNA (cytidine(34)-2'-O)-methyltransferase n=1 Tax=Oleisolibacter albus TaxID=2171757 RepID=UPI000DF2A33D|nr:tRNA (cytidine(34)-2'-O)-methyltransferase [Oleisolibacter albus]